MANRKPLVVVGGEFVELPDGDVSTPSGPAGGVLSGQFPNPGFAEPMATQAALSAVAASAASDATAKANAAQAASTPAAHGTNTNNPHNTTKAQVGLGNVDNTSDANKPVSTAQAAADLAATNTAKLYTDSLIANGIKFPAGSVATPGIAFAADPDTGLRSVSQGTVSLVLNGVDRLIVSPTEAEMRGYLKTSTANGGAMVGLRDAAPSWFVGDLKEATGSGSGMVNWVYGNNPYSLYISGIERLRLASTGNLLLGTASDVGGKLRVGVEPVAGNTNFNGIHVATNSDFGGSAGNAGLYVTTSFGGGTNNSAFFRSKRGIASAYNGTEIATSGMPFRILTSLTEDTEERFRVAASGHVGIDSIPSGWGGTNVRALDVSTWTSLANGTAFGSAITHNTYFDGSSWRYKSAGTASRYEQSSGEHRWYSAPAGAVNAGGTFTLGLSLNSTTLSAAGEVVAAGGFKLPNQKFLSSGSFGRYWGSAALAVGQAQYAGLYGPAITYNAKIVGSAWQSIGGGTATAMTMDEGIFSISQSQSVAADGVPLDWTTSMKVTPALAEFKGQLHADGGGVGWAPSGHQGAVLGRVGNDAYVSTFYDLSSLTIGAGSTQKNNITVFGHTHPSGSQITAVVDGANRLQIQGIRSRFFNLLVASGGAGNNYSEAGITVDGGGTDAIKPSLGFHQPGFFAGTLRQDDATQFGFYQIDGTSPADLYIRNLRTTGQLLAGVVSSTAKAHIDSSTYGAGLTVASIANTASQVNIGIGYLTAGRPFVGTNAGSNPFEIGTRAPTPTIFVANSVERMRLVETGELLLGRTSVVASNASALTVCADGGSRFGVVIANKSASNTSFAVFANSSDVSIGAINQSGASVTYSTTSDWRLKTNVRPSDAKRFMQIRFRDFEWVDGRHDCGVIAHELQEIYPDLVTGEKDAVETRTVEVSPAVTEKRLVSEAVPAVYDGDQIVSIGKDAVYETVVVTPAVTEERKFPVYQQVNYQGLIARMGTVIQQQNRTLEALTARIEALEKLSAK